ncbi:MAG: hypothetical protein WCG87_07205 [Bacteroidota bacterium]
MKKYFQMSLILFVTIVAYSCNSVSKYPIDKPSIKVDTNLIGLWKMDEDTNVHDFFVLEKYDEHNYAFTYMNHEGSNRVFENVQAFFSDVNNTRFLNVHYNPGMDETYDGRGYFFMKVVEMDPQGWSMTLSKYSDTTLKLITDPQQVREHIAKNINNHMYFNKPVHFHKILPLMYCK